MAFEMWYEWALEQDLFPRVDEYTEETAKLAWQAHGDYFSWSEVGAERPVWYVEPDYGQLCD